MKPATYPLPWCDVQDVAYWQVNLWLCAVDLEWRAWQRGRSMAEIIPRIDSLIP